MRRLSHVPHPSAPLRENQGYETITLRVWLSPALWIPAPRLKHAGTSFAGMTTFGFNLPFFRNLLDASSKNNGRLNGMLAAPRKLLTFLSFPSFPFSYLHAFPSFSSSSLPSSSSYHHASSSPHPSASSSHQASFSAYQWGNGSCPSSYPSSLSSCPSCPASSYDAPSSCRPSCPRPSSYPHPSCRASHRQWLELS